MVSKHSKKRPFSKNRYNINCVTKKARLLNQTRTFNNYMQDIQKALGFKLLLIKLFRPTIRYFLLKKSPYYRKRVIPKRGIWWNYWRSLSGKTESSG